MLKKYLNLTMYGQSIAIFLSESTVKFIIYVTKDKSNNGLKQTIY